MYKINFYFSSTALAGCIHNNMIKIIVLVTVSFSVLAQHHPVDLKELLGQGSLGRFGDRYSELMNEVQVSLGVCLSICHQCCFHVFVTCSHRASAEFRDHPYCYRHCLHYTSL